MSAALGVPHAAVARGVPRLARNRLVLAGAALTLASCASLSPDAGFPAVQSAVREHLPQQDLAWPRDEAAQAQQDRRIDELLAQPLTADGAVQLALLNNRGLQARFQDLGISAADVVQAGRLPNPGFRFGRTTRGDEVEFERGLHLDLARLLSLPLASRLEARRAEQVGREVASDVLALAHATRRAWVDAVAAEEGQRYAQQVQQAAAASAELARRMAAVGNFNALAQAREQAFQAEAAIGLLRADHARQASRERLNRLLGTWGTQTAYRLPERLPALPAEPADQPDIERLAMGRRLDLQAARLGVEQTARQLGLTRRTRFINVFELGVVRNSSNEAPRQTGWELAFELPLFDWGEARVARAEALYMQAVHRAAETAVNARSEVREAYLNVRSAYDIARQHRDELLPLRQRIGEEQLLRYNGMLIGVFELLADARVQITGVKASIESLRDFWLAQADLDRALSGRVALPATRGDATTAAPAERGGAAH